MVLSDVLIWVSIPFVFLTIIFGFYRGENFYYESSKYDGHGTAHKVLK
jgi:hypothetical protein